VILPAVYQYVGCLPGERLPRFAIGGYPLLYLTRRNDVLCRDCAASDDDDASPVSAAGVHLEGPPVACDGCGVEIESAYGDPDEGGEP
jgi:hypothetical protein